MPPVIPFSSVTVSRRYHPISLIAILMVVILCAAAEAARRPNIILIMTDDQGYGEMSCHGNPILKTPNLDRLHSESVRFVDFQVSPTCAPTRAALMTGRHEFRSGVTHTIYERERLSLDATTLPQLLQSAGYQTGIFGKWHLGDEEAYQPQQRGFNEVFVHGGGGIGQTYPGSCGDAPDNRYFDPTILHNGRFVKTKGYCTDVFFNQAAQWIDQQKSQKQPFFAYIAPNAPHDPFISPGPEYDLLFQSAGLNTNRVSYYSMIRNIDDNVGRLLQRLKDWKIEEETLVIFMTDNGHSVPGLYNAGMRAAKGTVYQGGTRAPSFWRWRGTLHPGDRSQLAAHIDILPTLADIAGVKVRKSVRSQWEGLNLFPVLKKPDARWPDRILFSHLGRWETGKVSDARHKHCAIRTKRYKLVNHSELYDLLNDPGETNNIANSHPKIVARLQNAYNQWWDSVLPAALENEAATGPNINPFKEKYWAQFGGEPSEELIKKMDSSIKFEPARMRW